MGGRCSNQSKIICLKCAFKCRRNWNCVIGGEIESMDEVVDTEKQQHKIHWI